MSVIQTNIRPQSTFTFPRKADIFGTVQFWLARAKQRRQLIQLDPEQLADMGITRAQAHAEAAKLFCQD